MDIVDVNLVSDEGDYSQPGPAYKRVYRVDFANGYLAAALMHNTDSRLPKYGDIPSWDTNCYVSHYNCKMVSEDDSQQTGSAFYNVDYSPLISGYQLNPLDRPTDIDWGGESQTEVMYVDEDGVAVLNSASDRYDPMPEREILGPCVVLTRYESGNPASTIETFSLSTNASAIWGQGANILKMGIITSRKCFENGVAIWQTRYPIYKNRKGWKLKLIDNGHRKLNDDGSRRRCHDDMGNTSPIPVLLDGSGNELDPSGTPVVFPTGGFTRYTQTAWSGLSLTNPWA